MKTVLVRAYASCNLGDDLFLKIIVERYSEVQFRIIGPKSYKNLFKRYSNVLIVEDPSTILLNRFISKLLGLISIKIKNKFILFKITNFYRKEVNFADAFLYIGGSIFIQNQGVISLEDNINKMVSYVFKEKPKFIIGANFGPFTTDLYVDFYKAIFKNFEDVCFREQYSKSLFKDLNNVRVCPDVVFQLKVPNVNKIPNSVGFSLIDLSFREKLYKYESNYLDFVKQIIEELLSTNRSVYLFSFCKAEGDEDIILKVISNLTINLRNKINIILYDGNIDKFLSEYAKVESMFSTRFHSMILSSLLEQNIFPIIYSKKMTNVLNDLDYQGVFSKITEFDKIQPTESLKNIIGSRLNITASNVKLSKNNFKFFDDFLSK